MEAHNMECFPGSSAEKRIHLQCTWFDSWVRKIPWRRDRLPTPIFLGFLCGSAGKEDACNAGRPGFDPWVGKIPWRREGLPTPVFWPGEFQGLYSPWGCKQWDMTVISLSLVAQCLAVHLAMQGTPVQSLVPEDPTCLGASEPVGHNYPTCPRVRASQQEKPLQQGACAPQPE